MPARFTSPRLAQWVKENLSWFSPALAIDWIVALVLVWISIRIERSPVFERNVAHYLHDNNVKWPHIEHERVPGQLLDQLTLYLPACVVIAVSLVRLSLHDLHHGLLALYSSRSVMRISIEWIKNRVGRLRPDFLERCAWDKLAQVCTGPEALVKDGRRSFPSGHSGTAFQAMFFLCLFIAGKNRAFALHTTFPRSTVLQSRLLRFSLAVSPLFLAAWIAITRLEDNWHHPTDVLAGSVIGLWSSLAIYQVYYPSPFRSDDWQAMDCPKLVYGSTEPEEGRIALALAGEEDEGLLSGRGDEEV
ncbi:hypothetical protein OIV83_004391 [Microbotryomycetes sp. JL201]|nr:hypothetical protein OIV83_004391 [Microbotryomycetes sp. JL201]